MRRPSLADPPLAAEVLHPTLQAALGSLDVQLEVELARYRRQRRARAGRAKPSAQTAPSQRTPKPIAMIAIGAIGGRTQPRQETPASVALDPSGSLEQDLWQPSEAAGHLTIASSSPTPTDAAASSQFASTSNPSFSAHPFSDLSESIETENYFASSEELLRSLADEDEALRSSPKNRLADLLTPLGIGSLLLLLLSSATIGYLLLNPASLKIFERFGNRNASQSNSAPAAIPADEATNPPAPLPDLASEEFKDLNLDTLSTLPKRDDRPPAPATAPTIATRPTALPTAAIPANAPVEGMPGIARMAAGQTGRSSRVVPARSSQSASSQPVARRSPSVVIAPPRPSRSDAAQAAPPARRAAARTPAAAPQPVARVAPPRSVSPAPAPAAVPVATAPAAPDSLHYVVTPYSGDRSLEQARQTSPDAYVRNFPDGARIQLGAFSDPARARELSQQLEQQGVSTQVYQP